MTNLMLLDSAHGAGCDS